MEWLKMLGSTKAAEIVAALVGGYLAAKNQENLTRAEFFTFVLVAIAIGLSAAEFLLPWLVEQSVLSEHSAINLRFLAIIGLAALSLKAMDLLYSLAYIYSERIKKLKLKLPGLRK
jgi:hypothetical protein